MKKYFSSIGIVLIFILNIAFANFTLAETAPATEPVQNLGQDCSSAEKDNDYCTVVNANKGGLKTVFNTIRNTYKKKTNAYFNSKLSTLSGTSFQDDKKRAKTENDTELLLIYNESQLELMKYLAAIHTLELKAPGSTPIDENDTDINAAALRAAQFPQQLAQEEDLVQRALRVTLASYAEMRTFYALHKELEALISELQKLQDSWINLVKQVVRMPAKFINAAKNFN